MGKKINQTPIYWLDFIRVFRALKFIHFTTSSFYWTIPLFAVSSILISFVRVPTFSEQKGLILMTEKIYCSDFQTRVLIIWSCLRLFAKASLFIIRGLKEKLSIWVQVFLSNIYILLLTFRIETFKSHSLSFVKTNSNLLN